MRLTIEKANALLDKARPEPLNAAWIRHSICVGDTAAIIAKGLGLEDPEYARALGYMHDIGKYKNPTNADWHDVLGYEYLLEEGIDEADAFICLTHSYINGDRTCTAGVIPEEHPLRCEVLQNHTYTIYEEIINLCDLMCLLDTLTMEKRLIDLLIRKGVHAHTHYHLTESLKLKQKFDDLLGYNLYDLFPDIQI